MSNICAYTAVCEEDSCWLDQYLAEAERLAMPFAMLLDRCSARTKERVRGHRLCIGTTEQNDPAAEFEEWFKQGPFDLVADSFEGYRWAMAWDVDETYEREAPRKLSEIVALDVDYVDITWTNLWGNSRHVRTDGPFGSGHRVKFYNLRRHCWMFTHKITNGPKAVDARGKPLDMLSPVKHREHRSDLVCLHWGMMTEELRALHKSRWDRIYTAAVGDNPYGFWRYATDETITPTIVEHDYL